jgi:4-hydroxy-tetrahydrodipicolinate synthase
MSTTSPFGRLLTAMVSPMRPDGSIDPEGAQRVARHLVDTGHDGIVVNGTTGESPTLSDDESIEMVRLVADAVGDRAAVVAGVGSNSTAHSVEMTRRAVEAGATGLLLVSPYYNKPTQAGLVAHCKAVAEVSDLPIMLYDIPGRTGIPFETSTLLELAQVPTIAGVKDAKGDPWATTHVLAATDLLIFSGDDANTLPWLALGAVGAVSVVGHVAGREYAAMIAAVDAGDLAAARAIHERLVPAVDAIMTPSQGAIMAKAALVEIGVIEHATVRLPLVESPPEHLDRLRTGLKESGLL